MKKRSMWYHALSVTPLFFCFGGNGELWGVAQLMFTNFLYFPLYNNKNIDDFWNIKKGWKGSLCYIFPVIPITIKGIKLYKKPEQNWK